MKLTFTNWNISKNFFILGRRMRKFSLHLQSDCSLAGQHTGATTKSRTRKQYMAMAVETWRSVECLRVGQPGVAAQSGHGQGPRGSRIDLKCY